VADGVEVVHVNGTVVKLPKLPECVEYQKRFKQQREVLRSYAPEKSADGWLDNTWFPIANNLKRFSGNYLVPSTPASDNGQILYYFIGAVSPVPDTILQPVLTYYSGWSIASWNCCPSGQAHESTPLYGFGPGSTLFGEIARSANDAWTITSTFNGKSTTLTVPNAGRTWTRLDVTLETYYVAKCNNFANGRAVFSNMQVQYTDGSFAKPTWNGTTGPTECNGRLVVVDPFNIYIQHN